MPLQTLPCRAFQRGFALGARLLPWRTPTVLSGAGSLLTVSYTHLTLPTNSLV